MIHISHFLFSNISCLLCLGNVVVFGTIKKKDKAKNVLSINLYNETAVLLRGVFVLPLIIPFSSFTKESHKNAKNYHSGTGQKYGATKGLL